MVALKSLLIVSAAAVSVQTSSPEQRGRPCLPEDSNHVVLYRGFLEWPFDERVDAHNIIVRGHVDLQHGADYIDSVEVSLVDPPGCKVAFQLSAPHADSAMVHALMLGSQPVVMITTESHGGSGNGFKHVLVAASDNSLSRIDQPDFAHSNMGGFYVGDLGGGRGSGAVVWNAEWNAGAHYDPHPYRFTFYRWNGKSFAVPEVLVTKEAYSAKPDAAPTALGFTFRDQTNQEEMPFALVAP